MSITTGDFRQRITIHTLSEKKRKHEPIVSLTAYDYATARLADEAGVEFILVGDSLAQVVLGYESTLPVTMEEMLHHTRAVRRAVQHAFLVADMPFGSYHTGDDQALENAVRFVKEGGAEAVKIEGGVSVFPSSAASSKPRFPLSDISGSLLNQCTAWAATKSRVRRRVPSTHCLPMPMRSTAPESLHSC